MHFVRGNKKDHEGTCVILGFCHGVNEIYIVLGFYTAYIGTLLLAFWENL
jgi:hypothetical protein